MLKQLVVVGSAVDVRCVVVSVGKLVGCKQTSFSFVAVLLYQS